MASEYENIQQLYSNYQEYNVKCKNNNKRSDYYTKTKNNFNENNSKKSYCSAAIRRCNQSDISPDRGVKIDERNCEKSVIMCQRPNHKNASPLKMDEPPSNGSINHSNNDYFNYNYHNNTTSHLKNYRLPLKKYFSCYYNFKSNKFTITLLLILSLLFKLNICCGFILDGTQNSFAQFRKWYTGLNGTLELEFKTEQPNGLVLYTDDGGTYDFFELKLVEGALRLRYNLGGGAQIITVGRDLHDGHWHKVQVSFSLTLLAI